jgi:hypothetical protein
MPRKSTSDLKSCTFRTCEARSVRTPCPSNWEFADVFNIRTLEPEGKLVLRLICMHIYQANALYGVQWLRSFLQRLPQVKPEGDTAASYEPQASTPPPKGSVSDTFRKFLDLLIRERGAFPLHPAPRTGDQPPRNA